MFRRFKKRFKNGHVRYNRKLRQKCGFKWCATDHSRETTALLPHHSSRCGGKNCEHPPVPATARWESKWFGDAFNGRYFEHVPEAIRQLAEERGIPAPNRYVPSMLSARRVPWEGTDAYHE